MLWQDGHAMQVGDRAYTAVMGEGFIDRPSADALAGCTTSVFVPMDNGRLERGIEFLSTLRASHYHYGSLLLAGLLPANCKHGDARRTFDVSHCACIICLFVQ